MASLSLIQLFVIIFFLIFVVILLYIGCRRIYEIVVTPDETLKERIRSRNNSSSSSNSGNSGGGASVSGRRNSQNSNNSVITINNNPAGVHRAQTIYVRAGNQVGGPHGPSSVYTIPVGSLDLRRTSVVIIQQPNNSAHVSIPQAVIEEAPPSYEECVSRVSSDPADIV